MRLERRHKDLPSSGSIRFSITEYTPKMGAVKQGKATPHYLIRMIE
jgi:hypothetical protein